MKVTARQNGPLLNLRHDDFPVQQLARWRWDVVAESFIAIYVSLRFSLLFCCFSVQCWYGRKKIFNWNSSQGLRGGRNCPISVLVLSRQWLRTRVTCFQEYQALRSALNSGENLKLSYLVLSCKLEKQNFSLELLALYEVWKVNMVLRKRQRPETPAETGTLVHDFQSSHPSLFCRE